LSTVLLAKDFVRYRLTGALATEPSDASATLMYDTANMRWSTEILAAVGKVAVVGRRGLGIFSRNDALLRETLLSLVCALGHGEREHAMVGESPCQRRGARIRVVSPHEHRGARSRKGRSGCTGGEIRTDVVE
jgi:hypothetical protein